MYKKLKNPPNNKAINVGTIKQFANIAGDDRDDQLKAHIDGAISYVQSITGRQLITASYEISLQSIEVRRKIPLSTLNVQEITSVKVYDCNDNETTVDTTAYRLSNDYIIFNNNATFSRNFRKDDAMIVEVVAGYGDNRDSVPDELIKAVSSIVLHRTNNSSSVGSTSLKYVPDGIKTYLRPYMSTLNWIA